ncbi:uncharacterized protein LOC125436508 [Sphaerodactylus townsendi]|uniref:uncharacterized protein LOC125436508 n=1 Tax=Sphaerodactylus townsendi TaxID=933632 RepID=UPI002025D32C|nr:uncharacterized protein LOC125436508 [Sphaerodactylus townsendi]
MPGSYRGGKRRGLGASAPVRANRGSFSSGAQAPTFPPALQQHAMSRGVLQGRGSDRALPRPHGTFHSAYINGPVSPQAGALSHFQQQQILFLKGQFQETPLLSLQTQRAQAYPGYRPASTPCSPPTPPSFSYSCQGAARRPTYHPRQEQAPLSQPHCDSVGCEGRGGYSQWLCGDNALVSLLRPLVVVRWRNVPFLGDWSARLYSSETILGSNLDREMEETGESGGGLEQTAGLFPHTLALRFYWSYHEPVALQGAVGKRGNATALFQNAPRGRETPVEATVRPLADAY